MLFSLFGEKTWFVFDVCLFLFGCCCGLALCCVCGCGVFVSVFVLMVSVCVYCGFVFLACFSLVVLLFFCVCVLRLHRV